MLTKRRVDDLFYLYDDEGNALVQGPEEVLDEVLNNPCCCALLQSKESVRLSPLDQT